MLIFNILGLFHNFSAQIYNNIAIDFVNSRKKE